MQFQLSDAESVFFYFAVFAIIVASIISWFALLTKSERYKVIAFTVGLAVFSSALSIGLRWMQSGNGPFITMYEVLISNFFSLGLIFLLVYKINSFTRSSALIVLPLLSVIGVWAGTTDMTPLELPATYDTLLLWIHVGVGKVFLGLCLISFGLASVLLMQYTSSATVFDQLPAAEKRDDLAWRFAAIAFVFHSLMLIAGAAWAQDAWGRFWAWDSLETWAFITWLVLGLSLHARVTWNIPPWAGWLLIICVFVLAMLTFFGVPFTSLGPHKGII